MSLREKFARLLDVAQDSVAYWRDIAITDFTRDLHARIQHKGLSHADLAIRLGTSRPYVTRLLSGGNYTLETMVKLAMALDGVIRVHLADRDAVTTHWRDVFVNPSQLSALGRMDSEALRRSSLETINTEPLKAQLSSLVTTALYGDQRGATEKLTSIGALDRPLQELRDTPKSREALAV